MPLEIMATLLITVLALVAANSVLLWQLRKDIKKMAGTILDLQNEVTALTTVEESAAKLLDGLSQQLKDALAQNDPTAIQKVIDDLDAGKANLAAAITRNTPAA